MALLVSIIILVLAAQSIERLYLAKASNGLLTIVLLLSIAILFINSQSFVPLILGQEALAMPTVETAEVGSSAILLPLILASLTFSLVEIVLAKCVSKKLSEIFFLVRPLSLLGFFFVSYRALSSFTLELFRP